MKTLSIRLLVLLFLPNVLLAQGLVEDFSSNTLNAWTYDPFYTLTLPNQELKVDVAKTGSQWEAFNYNFSPLDLSMHPYVKIMVKSSSALTLRIDLLDTKGRVTNQTEVKKSIPGDNQYHEYTYDFTGLFYQLYPTNAQGAVLDTSIKSLVIIVNPGGNYTGTIYIDNIRIGDATGILPPPSGIVLNQIGFYPDENKLAIVSDTTSGPFYIINSETKDTVFTGTLGALQTWTYSGEKIRRAVFSDLSTPGTYKLATPAVGQSHEFEIKDQIHHEVTKGLLKSYYYQRASMDLSTQYAGKWARKGGYPDKNVLVHPSAATTNHPANSSFPTPGGWFDAGDYGKYVVNSGISTYQLLALYEHYPTYFDTLNLNIPESNNTIPDILDEALYNLRWMLTMQDSYDGGVFHKTTAENHDAFVMPANANLQRYVFAKSTTATLDFAAVMAQASRIFKMFESEFPLLSDSMIKASIKAYAWADANRKVFFKNPLKIGSTTNYVGSGEYGDGNSDDEFIWARAELLVSTGDLKYYNKPDLSANFGTPGWANVSTLGLITLANYRNQLVNSYDTLVIKNKLTSLANTLANYTNSNTNAYGVALGNSSYDFSWGSNAVAGNQAMVLLQAYRISGTKTFFNAALNNVDYLFGRNATNYCFVTGYGNNSPRDIHHRPSAADGIDDPVPGFVSGGPFGGDIAANHGNDCPEYPYSTPGKMYKDNRCSYSTNENAINYNSSVVYAAGAIEALKLNANYTPPVISGIVDQSNSRKNLTVFPNPTTGKINISLTTKNATIDLLDITGNKIPGFTKVSNNPIEVLDISSLSKGVYILQVQSENGIESAKVFIE